MKVPFDRAMEELEKSMGHLIRPITKDGLVMIDSVDYPGHSFACFPLDGMFYYEL